MKDEKINEQSNTEYGNEFNFEEELNEIFPPLPNVVGDEVVSKASDCIPYADMHPALDLGHAPAINVLTAERFQERVADIFGMVSEKLAMSYGPYGSSTIISDGSFSHITKDGYSIMKKLSFSKKYTLVDDAVRDIIASPCTRLNYAVGDGTTTAIVSVNEIYQQYIKDKESGGLYKDVSPRNIINSYNLLRDKLIKKIYDSATQIDQSKHDEMVSYMKKIAYISSNADQEITNLIGEIYDEVDYPLIDLRKSSDQFTKKTVIKGYHFDSVLKDQMYVNNDNLTAELTDVDVLLFDHKVTMDTFNYILLPLNERCRQVQRHLVVIAPVYDDVAMITMGRKLLEEYKAIGSVNLILMVGSINNGLKRGMFDDLAMLLNTTQINMGLERDIIDGIRQNNGDSYALNRYFDIENRDIPGIKVSKFDENNVFVGWGTYDADGNNWDGELDENSVRVGYAGKAVLGMENGSTFDNMYYNKDLYDKTIFVLEKKLEEVQKKSEALESYNFQAKDIQTRLFKLKMRIGIIEVGGESMLSQGLLYDAVDDAIKATSSAYHNGVVTGCSVATLSAIEDLMIEYEDDPDSIEYSLLQMMDKGYRSVYGILLKSRFNDFSFSFSYLDFALEESWLPFVRSIRDVFVEKWGLDSDWISIDTMKELVHARIQENWPKEMNCDNEMVVVTSAVNFIINSSILLNTAFDISTGRFSKDIINSAKTDTEILLASSDLTSLLITGNQFIIADH